ncbi:unnamed protein product [Schistosoma margrebowiei]|uniref:DJ-1_PfpI domain-containing protein n=1 Tax=Schistosoma margrebowiei TaxID=48269 RepID=A0A183MI37_9TREM|nr:unnamed protein product [Schistosoma margrebowiei]VDP18984.1 unnamed protein product [Schistosoma margrebowiei]
MSVTALLILSEGAEEIEAVTVADVLARAGVNVTVGGLQGDGVVKGSNGVCIKPNVSLSSVSSQLFDLVVMPGGMGGSNAMASSKLVGQILKEHEKHGKYIAAICAAPIALESHKIAIGKKLTSYPGFEDKLPSYTYCEDKVVVDDKLVTSRGPGTALAFAMKLVELLCGKSKAQTLTKGMLVSL